MSEDGAVRMMAAQRDPGSKRDRSDHVIMNDGTLADLEASANRVLKALRTIAGGGTMRLDLHLHTAGSWDCLSDPEKVLERALAQGLDRIAITDHNKLHVALRMAKAYPDRIVPGEEVKTAEGVDVIGLYLTEEIPKGTPAVETIERIRAQGGCALPASPLRGWKGRGAVDSPKISPRCVTSSRCSTHGFTQRGPNDLRTNSRSGMGSSREPGRTRIPSGNWEPHLWRSRVIRILQLAFWLLSGRRRLPGSLRRTSCTSHPLGRKCGRSSPEPQPGRGARRAAERGARDSLCVDLRAWHSPRKIPSGLGDHLELPDA